MRVFLDNCIRHIAIQRMLSHWFKMGLEWSMKPEGCDAQLSLIHISTETDLPLVLRVDGIYYDTDTDYKKRNRRISDAHSKADVVIYQSKYCMVMCERYLRKRKKGAVKGVIYNGIDPVWCGKPLDHGGTNIVVSAKWRRHKRLQEIIDVFLFCRKNHEDLCLHILGDVVDNKKVKHPRILYYDHIEWGGPQDAIMENVYRLADISIHLSMKDCCPNSVVEAIGAGIPIITTTACGGALELANVFGSRLVIEREPSDPCGHYRDEYNKLAAGVFQNLVGALNSIIESKPRVMQPKELTAEFMAKSYLGAFNLAANKKET